MGIEKRKSPRIRLGVDAQYKVIGARSKEKKVALNGKISISGVMININKKIEKGTLLEFKIKLPSNRGTIKTKARVVYLIKNPKGEYPPYRCGLEFIELEKNDKENLSELIVEAFANLDWENMV